MMDHVDDGGVHAEIFVYMGGSIYQEVPRDVTHIRIHKSVKIIEVQAFEHCQNLVSIEMHDGVEIIELEAFWDCSLRRIKLPGVKVIEQGAFDECWLEDVEFGNKLETIGMWAFKGTSLKHIKIPTVRVIREGAFFDCRQLTVVELSEDLDRIEGSLFRNCPRLRCIAMPLKDNMFQNDYVFSNCDALSQVHLVGGIHKTISSLLLESWRHEMNDEIDRINRLLPNLGHNKTVIIRRWITRVLGRMEHYKSEHYALLKNNMTQLELALWKANLPIVDAAASRDDARITCGANIIIPHVLSFLNDTDEFPLRIVTSNTLKK